MMTEDMDQTTQLRTSNGPLERSVHRDADPTEKSLLTLIEERAVKAASTVTSDSDDAGAGRVSAFDPKDEVDDQPGFDRTMMRLGGNGF